MSNRSVKIDREIREPAVRRLEGDWGDYDPSLNVSWVVVRKHPETKDRLEGKGKIEAAPRIKARRDSRNAFAPIKPLLKNYRHFPIQEASLNEIIVIDF